MDRRPVRRYAVATLALAIISATATAHPVDEIVQGAYIAIEPSAIRLEFDVTPGPLVSGAILRDLDANADRRITSAEARSYARRVLARLPLTVDGARLTWRLDQVGVPSYVNLEHTADTIRIFAFAARNETPARHALLFRNNYRPAASVVMSNIFIKPASGWSYSMITQHRTDDGRGYEVFLVSSFEASASPAVLSRLGRR